MTRYRRTGRRQHSSKMRMILRSLTQRWRRNHRARMMRSILVNWQPDHVVLCFYICFRYALRVVSKLSGRFGYVVGLYSTKMHACVGNLYTRNDQTGERERERQRKEVIIIQPLSNPRCATGPCVKKQKHCQCLWRAAPACSRSRPSKCRFRHFCRLIIAALDLVVYS